MKTEFELSGCTALVTGAAGHLGRAMSSALGRAGAKLILTSRRLDALSALSHELEQENIPTEIHSCDLTQTAERNAFIQSVLSRHSQLDVLVHNAHAGLPRIWDEASEEDFQLAQSMAVTIPHALIQGLHPLLLAGGKRRAGGASVVQISSMYGIVSPDPRMYGDSKQNSAPYYGAAKAGMLQLTRYLAVHLASDQIRVNAIAPGPFPQPTVIQSNPAFCQKLVEKVPLGRLGGADELAGPLLFLASSASSFVTGITLPVDGGWTAW
jgi:NAD(P)-dependent dehydrogenase (short-subunit alcohol dehydrogenase family)